jgi:hypothetical protein
MKTRLRLLFYGFLIGGMMIYSNHAYSQATYSQDFESEDYEWSDFDFWQMEDDPCSGDFSFVTNLYGGFFGNTSSETISPSLGTSNGGIVTFSYDYKLVTYEDTNVAVQNEDNWGALYFYYGTSDEGPWTLIETVDPDNHIESASCTTRTITFVPAAGSAVFVRLFAQLEQPTNDFYVYIDDIDVTQAEPVACVGTPSASVTIASAIMVCNQQDLQLSLNPPYTLTGLEYQWQTSADGIAYEDVPTDGTDPVYAANQDATTWYRATITCAAGGDTVISTPVQVLSSGLDCLCEMEYASQVEPITQVQFAGIDNSSSSAVDGSPSVEDFTTLEPGMVTQGETYPITLMGNTNDDFEDGYEDYFKVYIDFNHNGVLNDEGETFELGSIIYSNGQDGVELSAEIEIPEDAMTGLTQMRIVKHWYDEFSDYGPYLDEPCGDENSGYGQTEDYLLNVQSAADPCETEAPAAAAQQNFCGGATVADLVADGENILWYSDETGGDPLSDDEELINATIYYASQTIDCESEVRTAVTALFTVVAVDLMGDVEACGEFELPALSNGAYYTESGGEGIMLEAGDEIEETTVLYIYAQAGTDPVCSAQTSFTVTINVTEEPDGDETQVIAVSNPADATIEDLVVEADGTVMWYASEEDAEDGVNPLAEGTVVTAGTYYATQTIDGCESEPFAVTADVVLGAKGFTAGSFTYHPNPVKDVLNLSYTENITEVSVHNLLGQAVIVKTVSQNETQLDMSQLAAGTYLVKVTSGDASETIKIVKQ